MHDFECGQEVAEEEDKERQRQHEHLGGVCIGGGAPGWGRRAENRRERRQRPAQVSSPC